MQVLSPAGNKLKTLEDRIACPEEGCELLVEHDKIFVFDVLIEGQGRERSLLPLLPDRKNTEAFRLKVPPAFFGRRAEERLSQMAAIF
jgi:hypothetical protein